MPVTYAAFSGLPTAESFVQRSIVWPNTISVITGAPNWGVWNFCDGAVGVAYDHKWDLEGCTSPTTYSVVSGSLPGGLSLNSISGNQGEVSGVPTTAGTYGFTLRATNSVGTTDKVFSIVISAASSGGGETSHTFVC